MFQQYHSLHNPDVYVGIDDTPVQSHRILLFALDCEETESDTRSTASQQKHCQNIPLVGGGETHCSYISMLAAKER
jgi:hypothetical protein